MKKTQKRKIKKIDPYCINSFLTFRYVVDRDKSWLLDWKPWWPENLVKNEVEIETAEDIINSIKDNLSLIDDKTGILLSGGIDSAILAAFVPRETKAFTIKFIAESAIDETIKARKYTNILGLDHHIINVEWDDYLNYSNELMFHKKSPLHPVEVPLYKVFCTTKKMGISKLIVGTVADSTFGGFDKLLSKDWSFYDFIKRYSFIDTKKVLKEPLDLSSVFSPFKNGSHIDVQSFIKKIHGNGLIQSFSNAAATAGVSLIEPYTKMKLAKSLDLNRIRNGESKYLLRELFKILYPDLEIPEKIPFSRPMDQWLNNWLLPTNDIFHNNLDLTNYTGDQKWLLYNLNSFIDLILTEEYNI